MQTLFPKYESQQSAHKFADVLPSGIKFLVFENQIVDLLEANGDPCFLSPVKWVSRPSQDQDVSRDLTSLI